MDQTVYLRINMQNATNGQYELFSPVPVIPTLTSMTYTFPSSEAEIQENKLYIDLAKQIETFFLQENTEKYHLTNYTYFEIDGIQADIYIYKHRDDTFYYRIISKNMEYTTNEEEDDVDFILYEKEDLDTLVEVLKHIKKVESTYKFLDFYLLSPEKMEKAKLHRTFIPLSPDKMCSVCYEPTLEYTTCHHGICLKCREKCIVKKNKYCPICRENELRYYPHEFAVFSL